MSLQEKLKTLVAKEINKATSQKLFESKEDLEAMGDAELINLANKSGIEELIVKDGEGNLTDESKNEIVQSLCNLENSADDIEEDVSKGRYYLFSDANHWHHEIEADSHEEALEIAKGEFDIEGEVEDIGGDYGTIEYQLKGTDYVFEIREVVIGESVNEAELDEADKKVSPFDAHEFLKNNGWLGKDFFTLSSSDVHTLLDYAKQVKYRKGQSAPGSTGRMFFYYLTNLAGKWTKKGIGEAYSDKNPKIDLYNKADGKYLASTNYSKTVKDAVKAYEDKYPKLKGNVKGNISESIQESEGNDMNYDDKFYVFDIGNGDDVVDKYTIILKADVDGEPDRRGMIPALASGKDPRGFMQHVELYLSDVVDMLTAGEKFLGDEIPFSQLPDAVQQFAINDYKDQLEQTESVNEAEGDDEEKEELPDEENQEQEELPVDDEPTEEEPVEDETEDAEKITVVVISPELKKDDAEDDDVQDSYNLENKDLINTNEHVEALFNGETLSEEFQAKAKVVFEAALAEHTKALRNKFIKEFRIR